MLKTIENKAKLRKLFSKQFEETKRENPSLNNFFNEANSINNVFIVGGYLRNILNSDPPRDLDIIVNFTKIELDSIIGNCFTEFKENRLGGFKVQLEDITMDVWSIDDNWAFKWDLIRNIKTNYVEKIAEGTFFNFDSLVLDLRRFNYSFKHYNSCANNNILDIIKRSSKYKKLNPTREANVLRAFYLKAKYKLEFSTQLEKYLKEQLEYLKQISNDNIERLSHTLTKYQKYNDYLTKSVLKSMINDIYNSPQSSDQKLSNQQKLF